MNRAALGVAGMPGEPTPSPSPSPPRRRRRRRRRRRPPLLFFGAAATARAPRLLFGLAALCALCACARLGLRPAGTAVVEELGSGRALAAGPGGRVGRGGRLRLRFSALPRHGRAALSSRPPRIAAHCAKPEVIYRGDEDKARVLGEALELQWKHGFPHTPAGFPQLTNGFHPYLAGMQPKAANELLKLLPGETLFDPFIGSGTTMIEGLRMGYRVSGSDISPLAVFITRFQTWIPDDESLEAFEEAVRAICSRPSEHAAGGARAEEPDEPRTRSRPGISHDELRRAICETCADLKSSEIQAALWFVMSAMLNRKGRAVGERETARTENPSPEKGGALLKRYERVAEEYARRIRSLRAVAGPDATAPNISRCDARGIADLAGCQQVDAVLTSPPYPAVYDYLSVARKARANMGGHAQQLMPGTASEETYGYVATVLPKKVAGNSRREKWPEYWTKNEIGSKRSLRRECSEEAYEEKWFSDQESWLMQVKKLLRHGGRCAIVIGDSDAGWIDTLETTCEAALVVGFTIEASASIHIGGEARTEHAILLQNLGQSKSNSEKVKEQRSKRLASRQNAKTKSKSGFKSWISGS